MSEEAQTLQDEKLAAEAAALLLKQQQQQQQQQDRTKDAASKPKVMKREDSLEDPFSSATLMAGESQVAAAAAAAAISSWDPCNTDNGNLPPGRMHAVRGHHRLHGSSGNLEYPSSNVSVGSSTGGAGGGNTTPSRSRSPSLGRGGEKATTTTFDANSSISSMEDILTDSAAFEDLSESQRRLHSSRDLLHLPPVINERLTEEDQLDCHAFSDLTSRMSSNASSRVSVVSNTEVMLEPLDECAEEDDDDTEDDEAQQTTTVILTNMENLQISASDDDRVHLLDPNFNTTESSLQGEAPSAPTA
jgi:hypothetical protein